MRNKILLLALIQLFILSILQIPVSAFSNNKFNALDSAIEAQMSKHGLPGVAIAVIEDGQIVYLRGYGTSGNGKPMTSNTQMFIGSQSKSFTALAIAQLADQGKIDLSAPVQTYIPWFTVADTTASNKITVNHLLHHTSGLSDSGYSVLLPLNANLEEAVRSLAKARLTASIGTQMQYFNMGYAVLAYIVEQVSGETYAEYIQTHIFTPLKMNSSTALPSTAKNLSQGYSRLFGFTIPMKQQVPLYAIGDGYIVSTAEDMAKYAIAMMTPDVNGLISIQMHQRIFNPGIADYGMGWFIVDNGSKIFHGGANETFRTEVNLYPKIKRAFILLTNEGHQIDHFVSASQLTSSVESVVLDSRQQPIEQGWSVRWFGWAIGIAVLGLVILHTHNFIALRNWSYRTCRYSSEKRLLDVAISFIIPIVISTVIFWQVGNFYGNRFNLLSSLVYMRVGMPDLFILILIGTLPDLIQGVIKIVMWTLEQSKKSLNKSL